jgi:hypothetical protein
VRAWAGDTSAVLNAASNMKAAIRFIASKQEILRT